MFSVANGEDKESRKQLKQRLKNISFFFAFVNFPANISYTPALGSKEIYIISSTWGPKMSNNIITPLCVKTYPLMDFEFLVLDI
jgi:hypothetical protein